MLPIANFTLYKWHYYYWDIISIWDIDTKCFSDLWMMESVSMQVPLAWGDCETYS